MRIRNKKMLLAAAIVLLLAVVAGIIIFDRDSSIDFEKKLELAEKYLESSDYDNAIAIYNGIIVEDDSCSEAYVGLAEAYYTKGNTEKALSILEKGLEYSADEDIVIEKIKTFFPDYDFESFGYENDEYYAEVPDEIESETENDETVASAKEITDVAEETTVTETTAVQETEETTATTTAEITTTAAPTVTTAVTTTTVPITTTTTTAAPVTTTAAPRTTTAETTTTTTAATTKEPEAVVVDDLTMMTVSEARVWCENNNLSLSVIGSGGEIISQSPAPGSIIEEYSEIIVRCE